MLLQYSLWIKVVGPVSNQVVVPALFVVRTPVSYASWYCCTIGSRWTIRQRIEANKILFIVEGEGPKPCARADSTDNMSTLIILLLLLPLPEKGNAITHYMPELRHSWVQLPLISGSIPYTSRGHLYCMFTYLPRDVFPTKNASGSSTRKTPSICWRRNATYT